MEFREAGLAEQDGELRLISLNTLKFYKLAIPQKEMFCQFLTTPSPAHSSVLQYTLILFCVLHMQYRKLLIFK